MITNIKNNQSISTYFLKLYFSSYNTEYKK